MSADHLQTDTGVFEKIRGVDALALRQGPNEEDVAFAVAKGVSFRNGTIEFDVQPFAMGTGLGFRRRGNNNFEYFYMRPNGKCPQSPDCLQYAPQTHGVLLWDVFPQFQAASPIHDGEWNHIKVVVSGRRMDLYVNATKSPSLRVGRLEGDEAEGSCDQAPARQRLQDLLHNDPKSRPF
jgi:hypothetical protein